MLVGDVAFQNALADPRFEDAHGYALVHTQDFHDFVAVHGRLEGSQVVFSLYHTG